MVLSMAASCVALPVVAPTRRAGAAPKGRTSTVRSMCVKSVNQSAASVRRSLRRCSAAGGPSEGQLSEMKKVASGELDPTSEVKVKALVHLASQEYGLTGVPFSDVLAMVNEAYAETPVEYKSGAGTSDEVVNPAGTNTGSCKIFYFAQLHSLPTADTLRLFCEHYEDVLQTPDGDSHANIRAFMKHGWSGINFSGPALRPRSPADGSALTEGI